MKKWTDDPATIASWLEEANERRQLFKPVATLPIEMQLKRSWRGPEVVASLERVYLGLDEKDETLMNSLLEVIVIHLPDDQRSRGLYRCCQTGF